MDTTSTGSSSWTEDQLSPSSPRREAVSSAGRQQAERQTQDSGPASRAAVAVACVSCRSRHLKCDGESPCSRCTQDGSQCSYVRSRRGWKGPRNKNGPLLSPVPATNGGLYPAPEVPTIDPIGIGTEMLAVTPGIGKYPLDFLRPAENRGQLVLYPPPSASLPVDASPAGLINAYYNFFHPTHPFLLPQMQMIEELKDPKNHQLELAIYYMGSFYVLRGSPETHQRNLAQSLQHALSLNIKTAPIVQAMLLYAIGLHMDDKEVESAQVLKDAIALAFEVGLHEPSFAMVHGGSGTRMEEYYRRIFWELFVLDGLFAGVNPAYSLQLVNHYVMDFPLPVEDSDYAAGHTSVPARTLQDYEDALFLEEDDEEFIFSSGTYRIDAIRIVHIAAPLSMNPGATVDEIQFAENRLMNWKMHLPDIKRRLIQKNGILDEVMFTAHMVISACTILLHRPRSDLSHDEVRSITTCANSPLVILADQPEVHTHKAMMAAMEICVLIKMPSPVIKHTPFFTCAINLAAVVYLSYWSFIANEERDGLVKEHIKLNIGALKTLAKVMPIAHTVLGQAKGVAQELFQSRKALNNIYLGSASREEILLRMIDLPEDDSPGMLVSTSSMPHPAVPVFYSQPAEMPPISADVPTTSVAVTVVGEVTPGASVTGI